MKTELLSLLSFVLMTLGFSACSSNDDIPEAPIPSQNEISKIRIGVGADALNTRTILNDESVVKVDGNYAHPWEWVNSDFLILSDPNGKVIAQLDFVEMADQDGYPENNLAIFEGETNSAADRIDVNEQYRLTYMGNGSEITNKTNFTFTVDFEAQDGSKGNSGLGTCDAMYSNVDLILSSDGTYINKKLVILNKLFSVAHFTIDDNKRFLNAGVPSATAVCGDGVYLWASVNIGGTNTTPVITAGDAATKSSPLEQFDGREDIYLTLVPGETVAPIFKRIYSNNGEIKAIAYGTPGSTTQDGLTAGHIYFDRENSTTDEDGKFKAAGIPVAMNYNDLIELNVTVTGWAKSANTNPTIENN